MKLSVPKDKENHWEFVDDAKKAEVALSKVCTQTYCYNYQMDGRTLLYDETGKTFVTAMTLRSKFPWMSMKKLTLLPLASG